MGYATKVELDNNGYVQRESLVSLTSADWGDWVEDRIHDRIKLMVRGDRDDINISLFSRLICNLETPQRTTAYEGIRQCLDRAYERRAHDGADWGDNSLDDLLLLVGGVETKPVGDNYIHQDTYFAERSEVITRFLDIVIPSPDSSYPDIDVYSRLLQTLCGIEAKLPLEFWLKQLQVSQGYAPLCFSGASYNSSDDAIELLSHVDWSSAKNRDRMELTLFYFYFVNHDNPEVSKALERKKQSFSQEVQPLFERAESMASELVEYERESI